MIISPNRQFVFIHLHKCAGTSIECALATQLGPNDLVVGSTPSGERYQWLFKGLMRLRKHATAAQIRQRIGLQPWANWYTFAFVRHPLNRLQSLYAFALTAIAKRPFTPEEQAAFDADGTWPDHPPYRYQAVRAALTSPSFNDFVLNPLTWLDPGAAPLWKSLCDPDGQLLVKFVGKVENFEADWQVVQDRLQIQVPVGHHNVSALEFRQRPASLTATALALLESQYRTDLNLFGYELPALTPQATLAPAPEAAPWPQALTTLAA